MRVLTESSNKLQHCFFLESHHHRHSVFDHMLIAALAVLGLCWWYFGAPIELPRASSQDVFASGVHETTSIPASPIVELAVKAVFVALGMFGAALVFQYRAWRDTPISLRSTRELIDYTADIDFVDSPHLRFPVPVELMTNKDLSAWCRMHNYTVRNVLSADDKQERQRLLSIVAKRLSGAIRPRPFRLKETAWYLPRRYELAQRNARWWYFKD